jgi:hypothetical protein
MFKKINIIATEKLKVRKQSKTKIGKKANLQTLENISPSICSRKYFECTLSKESPKAKISLIPEALTLEQLHAETLSLINLSNRVVSLNIFKAISESFEKQQNILSKCLPTFVQANGHLESGLKYLE